MAFSAALRRAASAAAPVAIRFLWRGHHADRCTLIHILSPRTTIGERTAFPFPSAACFSSAAKKPATDADLLRVIESEIKCAEETDDHDRVSFLYSLFRKYLVPFCPQLRSDISENKIQSWCKRSHLGLILVVLITSIASSGRGSARRVSVRDPGWEGDEHCNP